MPIPLLPLRIHVDHSASSSDGTISLDSQALLQIEALISQHVPGMSAPFAVTSVVVVCGGYTNNLYKLSLASAASGAPLPIASLLLRIYGAGTEKLIDRSVELSLLDHLAVHAPDIAPVMYVAFANGRLEQFIEGARALEAADMRHAPTSALIARTMARLHSLPLPSSVPPQPACWSLIESWLNGEKESLLLEQASAEPALHAQRMQTVQDALALAHELLPLLRDDATVLCHNDLLCGNILQEIGSDRLYLIDYEYGAANSPAFDIANHFVEWQAFEDQAANQFIYYPTQQQKQHFVSAYAAAIGGARQDELEVKIDVYILVAHLLWASWGLYQARTSCIDFDYRSLAANRFAQAHKLKQAALERFHKWRGEQ